MLKKLAKKIIPPNILRVLVELFDGYSHKIYSQNGEDFIVQSLLYRQKKGFYIDIGAHHPIRYSNTFFFYKRGWSGINIDAMPGSMKAFKRLRHRDINLEKAINNKKEILTYHEFNEPALNSFSEEISKERDGFESWKIISKKEIETITLEEILDQYLPNNTIIDFLSIDVEGLDFAVLQSNNWEKYRPKVILVEILGSSIEELSENEVYCYLKNMNYKVYSKCGHTVIFTQNNHA